MTFYYYLKKITNENCRLTVVGYTAYLIRTVGDIPRGLSIWGIRNIDCLPWRLYSRTPWGRHDAVPCGWDRRVYLALQRFNLSASSCCVFATRDLRTWFSVTFSWLNSLKFVINSSNFMLFRNIYVSFWNSDLTKYEWTILAARFECARFEK